MYDDELIFYEDESECEDCQPSVNDYDYNYDDLPNENLIEIYENCVIPSISNTFRYLIPFFIICFILKILIHFGNFSDKILHIVSFICGIYIIYDYVPESLYLLEAYTVLSYICLSLPKQYKKGFEIFALNIITILYCEYMMNPTSWHKIRGVVMIAAMKTVSVSLDRTDNVPNIWEYIGYIFNPMTCLFGPWISFQDFISIIKFKNKLFLSIVYAIKYLLIAFIFLSISNCWIQWIIKDTFGKWLLAYKDALSFRTSHYFICFISASSLSLAGFTSPSITVTKPLDIELPRSLVQVVILWNIPMHNWLKSYIFRPASRHVGKFGAVLLTYVVSSLLHGLNFQLAAVLLSLGFYTYVEYQIRNILANTFDLCIGAKKCCRENCHHKSTSKNYIWMIITNLGFTFLTIFHLAYLGLMFDTSELQESGYNYSHTIDKWSQLGFASHWMALATYLIYFLIR